MGNQQDIHEDEVYLRDCINIIIKRKNVVLTVFFAAMVITAIANYLMPQTYETSSEIQIGRVDPQPMYVGRVDPQPMYGGRVGLEVVQKEEVVDALVSQNLLVPIIQKLGINKSDIIAQLNILKKRIMIDDIKDTDLLRIRVQYPDAEISTKINKEIDDSFVSKYSNLYKERVSSLRERAEELEKEINITEGDIKNTRNTIDKLYVPLDSSKQDVSLRIILLQHMLPVYEDHLDILKSQKYSLENSLTNALEFKVIEEPIKPLYPIKPHKTLNILISAMLGSLAGIFIAFFIEGRPKE